MMHVTIAICTWNRASQLSETLDSVARLNIPADVTWEVLVINNNSNDNTEQVLDEHQQKLPLRRLFVAKQGKAYALNKALPTMQGDLILWSDDDVQFDADWLAAYVDAARFRPDVAFFGGPVTPKFTVDPPEWVVPAWRTISGVFATRELGDKPFLFDEKELPFGANFAVRTRLQVNSKYNPRLGRNGKRLLSNEETAIMRGWLRQGYRGMWVPTAKVDHIITPDRLTLDYVRRFFLGLGQTRPDTDPTWYSPLNDCFRTVWSSYQILRTSLLMRWHQNRNSAKWVKYIARSCYHRGRVECHREMLWERLTELQPPAKPDRETLPKPARTFTLF